MLEIYLVNECSRCPARAIKESSLEVLITAESSAAVPKEKQYTTLSSEVACISSETRLS